MLEIIINTHFDLVLMLDLAKKELIEKGKQKCCHLK